MLADEVGRHSQPVFPWHSLLPFLHITSSHRTPLGTQFNDLSAGKVSDLIRRS